jgi:hypothetical protein
MDASKLNLVYLEGPPGTSLERDTTGNHDWAFVCVAPCSVQVPGASLYRVSREGAKPGVFALRAPSGTPEHVVVRPASKTLYVAGEVGVAIGLVVGLDNATTRVTQVFAGDTPPPVPAPKWKPIHSGSELRLPPVAAWPLISATF